METRRQERSRHIISLLLENDIGSLARVICMFRRRNFRIESLAVGESEDPAVARMTIVLQGDEAMVRQVVLQVRKMVDVLQATAVDKDEAVSRELVLIKVSARPQERTELFQIAEAFRAKVIDVSVDSLVLEATGTRDKVQALLTLAGSMGVREVSRTGLVAMGRGSDVLRPALDEPASAAGEAAPAAGD